MNERLLDREHGNKDQGNIHDQVTPILKYGKLYSFNWNSFSLIKGNISNDMKILNKFNEIILIKEVKER